MVRQQMKIGRKVMLVNRDRKTGRIKEVISINRSISQKVASKTRPNPFKKKKGKK